MKSVFIQFCFVSALVAIAVAYPSERDAAATIVRSEMDNIGVGDYSYASEESNGILRQEQGTLENAGTEQEAISVRGSFSYFDEKTNQQYTVNYIADRNGM